MCGFVGIASQDGSLNKSWLRDAQAAILHRGPDLQRQWLSQEANIGLAHNRLSIIDLSNRSSQPMISGCGRYVVVYNGEIYNFKELRNELKKMVLFSNLR